MCYPVASQPKKADRSRRLSLVEYDFSWIARGDMRPDPVGSFLIESGAGYFLHKFFSLRKECRQCADRLRVYG
jgi:hypothetical protein